jgi:hypothetical protein
LRQAIGLVNPKKVQPLVAPSEDVAALSLLKTVADEEPSQPLPLDPFRTERAATRLALLALASLHPLDVQGNQIDIAASFEAHGVDTISELVRGRRGALGARGFWPIGTDRPTGHEPEEVLRSHAIDEIAAEYLRARDVEGFVQARGQNIERLVHRFLAARVEARSLARPPLSKLVVPDEDEVVSV